MPNHYVEDYEELTGKKPEATPAETIASTAETKVVEAEAEKPAPKKTARAKTK